MGSASKEGTVSLGPRVLDSATTLTGNYGKVTRHQASVSTLSYVVLELLKLLKLGPSVCKKVGICFKSAYCKSWVS